MRLISNRRFIASISTAYAIPVSERSAVCWPQSPSVHAWSRCIFRDDEDIVRRGLLYYRGIPFDDDILGVRNASEGHRR